MYTRSYFTEEKYIEIPESYDGNAFAKTPERNETNEVCDSSLKDYSSKSESEEAMAKGSFTQLFEKLPFKSILNVKDIGAYFSRRNILPEKIGIEEVLLLALALYMFFSKDGDKECAIMLAILIFIN